MFYTTQTLQYICFKASTVIVQNKKRKNWKKGDQKDGTHGQNIIENKIRLKEICILPNLQALAASNVSHLDLVYNNDLVYNGN